MRTLPAILSFLLLVFRFDFLFVFRLVFGVAIDFYCYIRASYRAKGTAGALDLIRIGGYSFLEASWVVPFGVQSVGYFYLLLRANVYTQSATFAPLLIDFNAAFHCHSPLLAWVKP
jgi:hypothetical protein